MSAIQATPQISDTKTLTLVDKLIEFWKKYHKYIILIILMIIVIVTTYKMSFHNEVGTHIKLLNKNYNHIKPVSLDLCSQNLKKHRACEFYVASSYNNIKIGLHSSLEILKKILIYGARYLELDIMNKTLDNKTIPVVSIGINKGEWKLTENYYDLDKVFKIIADIAFSPEYINNYQDPLFLFLNININNNQETLDKVYDSIRRVFGYRLLGRMYHYQKMNIALESLCNLMGKVVIMSQSAFKGFKINKLINCSLEDRYLKRGTIDELDQLQKMTSSKLKPSFYIKSSDISFHKGFTQDYIKIKNNDFLKMGVIKDFNIEVSGAKKDFNNSNSEKYVVTNVTKDRLILDPNNKLVDEPAGNEIIINFYSADLIREFSKTIGMDLPEYNKSNLTICVPNNKMNTENYNPFDYWTLGIQFVSMDYNVFDIKDPDKTQYMKLYLNNFKNTSFVLKPTNLRIDRPIPRTASIDAMTRPTIQLADYDIDYSFFKKFKGSVTIHPYSDAQMRLINDNFTPKVSVKYDDINSYFTITPGLNGKTNSISLVIGERYLISTDSCCYLTFQKPPKNNRIALRRFKDDATFFPVKSLVGKKDYYSFVSAKDELYTIRQGKKYKGPNYKNKHYLKARNTFNPKTKLYIKQTDYYSKVITLNSNKGKLTVFRPDADPDNNFYPIGHYCHIGNHMPKSNAFLVSGAVERPLDYELIWDNKGTYQANRCSIWRPIPAEGYIALGNVVTQGYKKPSIDEVRCVQADYTSQITVGDSIWDNKGTNDKDSLSFWDVPGTSLFLAVNSLFKPSEFDSPVFNLSNNEIDFKDRVLIGTHTFTNNSKESASFQIRSTSLMENSDFSKKISQYMKATKNRLKFGIEKMNLVRKQDRCLSLDNAYWSGVFNDDSNENVEEDVVAINCKDGEHFGSNWEIFPDKSIRLSKNNKFCLTANIKNEEIITSGHGKTFQELYNRYGDDAYEKYFTLPDEFKNVLKVKLCNESLKGQKFRKDEKGNFIYSGDENFNSDACITYPRDLDNYVRMERCSNKKSKYQNWILDNDGQPGCYDINSSVYILKKIERGRGNWNYSMDGPDIKNVESFDNESYDEEKLHVYLKGNIISKDSENFVIKYQSGIADEVFSKSSEDILLDIIPKSSILKPGVKVICKNKGLTKSGYEEENIMWKGTIVKKINKNNYIVVFSKNSIELDLNRDSMGRPRNLDIKEVRRRDLRVIKSYLAC